MATFPHILVTGIGILSPAGLDTRTTWEGLLAGGRFVRAIDDEDRTGGGARPAGILTGFAPPAGMETADRVCQLAVAAADEAARSADLRGERCRAADPGRTAVSFGTSKGGIATLDRLAELARAKNSTDLHASSANVQEVKTTLNHCLSEDLKRTFETHRAGIQKYLHNTGSTSETLLNPLRPSTKNYRMSDVSPDAAARYVAQKCDARAGVHCTVAACSTGTLAVIRAVQMLADGQADVVIAGSSDASVLPLWFAAFARMGVLAAADPRRGASWACRPFDRTREGFVIGEGAGAIVLETAESARRRGAAALARVCGYAMGTDPAGLARLGRHGTPLARTIQAACHRAGVQPGRLAAIQAHGTGTTANDQVETRAIRAACGGHCDSIPVVSFKGSLGHLLGAAGAVEIAMAIEAVRQRRLPPNATLEDPDPSLGPVRLPRVAADLGPGPILKTSMGFGGHLAAVVIDQA